MFPFSIAFINGASGGFPEDRRTNEECRICSWGFTSIYRKYLDQIFANWEEREHFKPEESDIHALEELYCRGSFTTGYWKQHNGQNMMSVLSPKNTGRLNWQSMFCF